MQTLRVKAPAKINLYLNILGKRSDGFHNIDTVFEKIDLCDEIVLKRGGRGIRLLCRDRDLPSGGRNLAVKAAALLFKKANIRDGVEIRLTKRIPVAAGLGGGSSNAAGVLLGLNRLFSLGLHQRQLLDIAGQLGADVPFFILPQVCAIGRGKGERLTPLDSTGKRWYILTIPPLKVSTRRMYQEPTISLTKGPLRAKIIYRALKENDLTGLDKYSYNSFAPFLQKKYKEILQIQKALISFGARTALISGSGPSIFGVCAARKEAMDISRKMQARKRGWQVIVAKTYKN